MPQLQEIRNVFKGLETLYQRYLPKVDPALLHDLLICELEEKSSSSSAERAPDMNLEE